MEGADVDAEAAAVLEGLAAEGAQDRPPLHVDVADVNPQVEVVGEVLRTPLALEGCKHKRNEHYCEFSSPSLPYICKINLFSNRQ